MEKRGQVSIFIVLGVVILLIIASLLFLSGVVQTSSLEQDDAVDLQRHAVYVQQYVDNCVEDTAAKSLVTLGYRGGKDALVGPFFDEEFFDSNYVLYNGDSHVATVQEMESHLEGLMDKHVQDCLPPADNNNILVENDIVNPGTLFQSLRMNHDNPTTDV
ncbi:TPA: hypothetical protein HA278_03060, partial [Candidatus Woesearchaeota archaeon]|nr:hypothetical protein [Candidatus Woesearchaeota archaeon]